MIKKIVAIFCLLLPMERLWSQTPPDLDEQLGTLTTPSANVASLLKFTEIPVNYYTGTPDISVPIYTINTGKLSLPITLRYSASGIRVGENSGNVGLGWQLSAEGIINETVLGIPDNNTYHQNGLGWDNAGLLTTDPQDLSILESISTGGQDGAPDLFTFSFPGYSGKFIYADVIRTMPQQNLAISIYLGSGGQPEWKIVTQDGTKYIFQNIENTANRSSESISRSRAWYLNKIVDANNTDSIILEYEPTLVSEVVGRSYSFTTWRPNYIQPLPFSNDMQPNDPPIPGAYNAIEQMTHGWQLKRISWNNGSIEYDIAWNDRLDLPSGNSTGGLPRIANILLKNEDDETIRAVHFSHDYFQTPNLNDIQGRRLRLQSVTFAPDVASINSPQAYSYSFEYNPMPLPSKLSNQIDHWGFYNGANINNSRGLIPSFTYPGMHYYGANRDANPFYAKAAMLTKMYYPTGGYAAFQWDIHAKTYPTQQLDSTIEFSDSLISMAIACEGNEEITAEWEDHIAIPTTPTDVFGLGVEATWGAAMGTSGQNYMLTVNHAAGGAWLVERPVGQNISYPPVIKASKSFSYQATGSYQYSTGVTLMPGKYYGLKGHINHPGFSVQSYLKVKWPRKVAHFYTPPSDYLGGCRIRNIVLFDTFTNKTIVKNYEYSMPSFMGVPDYHQPLYKFYFNSNNPPGGAGDCNFWQQVEGMYVSSNSIHNFNAGVQAGYDWVKETIGNGDGGSTMYKYINFNQLNRIGEVPATWRYGRLREKSVLNSIGQETQVTRYNNVTVLNPAEHFAGHTAQRIASHPCYSPGSPYPVSFSQKVYDFPCDWIYTDTIKVFDSLSGITTVNVTSYDNPQHREPTRTTTFNSDGSRQTTFVKYPTDFALSNSPVGDAAGIVKLQEKHMHNTPVEQYIQRWDAGSSTAKTIAAGYNQFKGFNSNDAILLSSAQRIDLAEGITNFQPSAANTNTVTKDSRYNTNTTVQEYGGRNNYLTMLKDGNNRMGYIWGYNNSMPIAKVVNDSFSNKRAFTSFERNSKGNWSYNENNVVTTDHLTGKRAYNLSLGNGPSISIPVRPGDPVVPHQTVQGEYILSYWKKGGNVGVNNPVVSTTTGMTANGWTYCEHLLAAPLNFIELIGSGLIDEVRFYPKHAEMESFTYDPLLGITSTDDSRSSIILFEYDAMGRLCMEKDVFGNILKKYSYQYLGDQ